MMVTLLIAFAAWLPLAALGLLVGHLTEKAGAGPRLRSAIWGLAFLVPMGLAPASLIVEGLDLKSPLAVVRPLIAPVEARQIVDTSPAMELIASPGRPPSILT